MRGLDDMTDRLRGLRGGMFGLCLLAALSACTTTAATDPADDDPPIGDEMPPVDGDDPPGDGDTPPPDDDDEPPPDGVIDDDTGTPTFDFPLPELAATPLFDIARQQENQSAAFAEATAPSERLPFSGLTFYEGIATLDVSTNIFAIGSAVVGVEFERNLVQGTVGNFNPGTSGDVSGALTISAGALDRSDPDSNAIDATISGDLILGDAGTVSLEGPITGELRGGGSIMTLQDAVPGSLSSSPATQIGVTIVANSN